MDLDFPLSFGFLRYHVYKRIRENVSGLDGWIDPIPDGLLRQDQRHPIVYVGNALAWLPSQNHKYRNAVLQAIQAAQPGGA